jgi:hypothetical protein
MELKAGTESDNRWELDAHDNGWPASAVDDVVPVGPADASTSFVPQSVAVPSETARMVNNLAAVMPTTLAHLIPRAEPTALDTSREFPLQNIVSYRSSGAVDVVIATANSILCWSAPAPSKLKSAKLAFWRAVDKVRCVHLVEQRYSTKHGRPMHGKSCANADVSPRSLAYVSTAEPTTVVLVSLESTQYVHVLHLKYVLEDMLICSVFPFSGQTRCLR